MIQAEHQCKALPSEGIAVVQSEGYIDSGDWSWCMIVERCATEADLNENGHLEEVGETIWRTLVGISHCPFCGEALDPQCDSNSARDAHFVHLDLSNWRAKIQ